MINCAMMRPARILGTKGMTVSNPTYRVTSGQMSTRSKSDDMATLVLLRHGQSIWNAQPTFTGWADVPLTARGKSEAREAGNLLLKKGYRFHKAFTSDLERAWQTCELALEAAGSNIAPVKAWQLNERHYGFVQGRKKDDPELELMYGEDEIKQWRRAFRAAPPPMESNHPYWRPPPAPLTESLACCQERMLEFWHETITHELTPGKRVLISAHANTLRALLCYLDSIPEERAPDVHVPNGVPCVFHLDPSNNLAPVSPRLHSAAGGSHGEWLLSPENHERLRGKIGGTGSFTRSLFRAWDLNGDGELSRSEMETGLRQLKGSDDICFAALAGRIIFELDADENGTISLDEFEHSAIEACRKFAPDLLEDVE